MNDDLSGIQDTNIITVEIAQESTTPENVSSQEKLANTGEVNVLIINELNESSDLSHGSRSSSVAMETQMAMTNIEGRTEMMDNNQLSVPEDMIDKKHRRSSPGKSDEVEYDDVNIDVEEFDSEEETIDRIDITHQGNTEMATLDMKQLNEDGGDEYVVENGKVKNEENENRENLKEIDELISEEFGYYDTLEKSELEDQLQQGTSIREEIEKSVSEGRSRKSEEFKVMDRFSAPKVMLEYEPSTTEAEDSDTLETESLQEKFAQMVKTKKKKKLSSSEARKKTSLHRTDSMNSDKEVARALADESPSTFACRQIVPGYNRGSTEPTTQDTMGEQTSLAEDDGEEVNDVCCENNTVVILTMDMQ